MVLVGKSRNGTSLDDPLMFSKGEGFVGGIWDKGNNQFIKDIEAEASDIIVTSGERRYNSIAGVPFKHKDEIIGIVVIASQQEGQVSEKDYDNIERHHNLIELSLLIELSHLIVKGGDGHAILLKTLSEKESF